MAYLLDTNHCFLLIGRDPRLIAAATRRSTEHLLTSVIVSGELRYGAAISERNVENAVAVESFLDLIDEVQITPRTAEHYADLKSRLLREFGPRDRARRRNFDLTTLGFTDNDLWIAASALEQSAILVSADSDHRRISEVSPLVVENWLG